MRFKSKWLGLTVLVPEEKDICFKNGEYETVDKKEIAILKKTADVEMLDEPKEKE